MGRDLTPSRLSHIERQTRDIRGVNAQLKRKRRTAVVSRSQPPWHIRHLAGIIVGSTLSVLLMLGVLVVHVVNDGFDRAQQTTEVQTALKLADRLVDVIEDQNKERQRIAQEIEKTKIGKAGMIFWIAMAAMFLLFSAQFAPPWGFGIGVMMIIMMFGVYAGYIVF